MKIELKDLEIGNKVWCGGDSGFCHDDIETVANIEWQFDRKTGEKFKVIILRGNREFDSRSGAAITAPTAYYLLPTNQ